jgi:cytochrome c oxidase subunit III
MSASAHSELTAAAPHGATGHDAAAGHGHEGGVNTALLGMLLFIASEGMFFGGLFGVYFNVRASHGRNGWPPEGLGEHIELLPIALPATIALVISSFTMQWAVSRIRRNDRTGMNRALAVTLLLGVGFLIAQVVDYGILYSHGLTINGDVYGSLFYTMTGFHGAHVFGGIVGILVVLARGMGGQFSARHHAAVEAVSIYWHFVDVVWIGLLFTLYVLK